MRTALQLGALTALAALAIAGCGGGSGGGAPADSSAAGADVPQEATTSWPAMYGYLLATLATAPDEQEPARVTGDIGPTSDVVEAEARP